jgi:DNA-binding XRE family transcriptional regulator
MKATDRRFPALLRLTRLARGLTQEQAAREVGTSVNTWARWERGSMTPSAHRNRVEDWLEDGKGDDDGRREDQGA